MYAKYEDNSTMNNDMDIVDCIAEYFKKDNLGTLSNLHLALCDQLGIKGPFDKDCIELSRLISVAVDFAKHGKYVEKEKYEKQNQMVQVFPDYMEKSKGDNILSLPR